MAVILSYVERGKQPIRELLYQRKRIVVVSKREENLPIISALVVVRVEAQYL